MDVCDWLRGGNFRPGGFKCISPTILASRESKSVNHYRGPMGAPEGKGQKAKWRSYDTRHLLAELTPKPDQVRVAIGSSSFEDLIERDASPCVYLVVLVYASQLPIWVRSSHHQHGQVGRPREVPNSPVHTDRPVSCYPAQDRRCAKPLPHSPDGRSVRNFPS